MARTPSAICSTVLSSPFELFVPIITTAAFGLSPSEIVVKPRTSTNITDRSRLSPSIV